MMYFGSLFTQCTWDFIFSSVLRLGGFWQEHSWMWLGKRPPFRWQSSPTVLQLSIGSPQPCLSHPVSKIRQVFIFRCFLWPTWWCLGRVLPRSWGSLQLYVLRIRRWWAWTGRWLLFRPCPSNKQWRKSRMGSRSGHTWDQPHQTVDWGTVVNIKLVPQKGWFTYWCHGQYCDESIVLQKLHQSSFVSF